MDENKEIVVETNEEVNTPSYFVGIKFNENSKAYFFSTDEGDLKVGDVVETRCIVSNGAYTAKLIIVEEQ